MRLVWAQFALSDRDDIFTHIEARSPRAAALIDDRIVASARSLQEFPQRGRPGRIVGVRELMVPRTPYILIYTIDDPIIRVLRVLHGARIWPDEQTVA